MGIVIICGIVAYAQHEERLARRHQRHFLSPVILAYLHLFQDCIDTDASAHKCYVPSIVYIFDGDPTPIEITKILLKHGIDINAEDYEGVTALDIAAKKGGEVQVRFLLENGANPNSEARNGQTPLFSMPPGKEEGDETFRVAALLLEAGADPCRHDREGRTAAEGKQRGTPVGRLIAQACQTKRQR